MITLRKHKHCKSCGKPLKKDFVAQASGALRTLSIDITWFVTGVRAVFDECQDCFDERLVSELKGAFAEMRRQRDEVHEARLRNEYLRGYDRRPKQSHFLSLFGVARPTYIECPLCDERLDDDNVYPQCNREYEPG